VWLPSRVETAIALLACSRNGYVCCPSLHRDHRVGEIAALVDRRRAAALIAQPGYGADADRHDIFAEFADRDFLRCAWRVGPPEAAPFSELPGPTLETEASGDANQVMYFQALPTARMRVFMEYVDWVIKLIGNERATRCVSLPRNVRERLQEP
jgi:hypothetical protein